MSIEDHPAFQRRTDDAFDVDNHSANPFLHDVIAARVSRRGVLGGGLATAASSPVRRGARSPGCS